MTSLVLDLRYAFRMLVKHRLLTASAVSTMALAIAANTAIFSLVYGVLLKPLALPDPQRVVRVEEQHQGRRLNLTGATFVDLRASARTLDAVAAYRILSPGLADSGSPEQVTAAEVSADYFAVLGVAPAVGRWFMPPDFVAESARTAIVSDGLWRRRFGADPSVLEKRVSIDGVPTEIIGVAPPRMFAPGNPDLWIPSPASSSLLRNRRAHLFTVIGRINPLYSIESTSRELGALSAAIEHDSGSIDPHLTLIATPLNVRMVQNARPAILMLWAGVTLLMLIAAANIANLLLMHGAARARELSIRIALGAGRSRIGRQLAIESIVLTFIGGVLGTCLGAWSLPVLRAALPSSVPRASDLAGDPRVLIFGVCISVVMFGIFGIPFTLRSSMRHPIDALRSRTSDGGPQSRTRAVLVGAEITLTVMLLVGTGLLGHSLWRLLKVEPGFNPTQVLTFRLSLPSARYPDAAAHAAFYDRVLERITALPGIVDAGVTGALPLTGTPATTMEAEGRDAEQLAADVITATPGFFRALHIPLRQGRVFTRTDVRGTPPVAVINEAAARRFWPDAANVIGRHITMKDWGAPYGAQIVGIVGNVRQAGTDADPSPAVYYPLAQFPETTLSEFIVVRTTGNFQQTISAIKDQVWAIDPNQALSSIRSMEEIISASIADRRFNVLVIGAFAIAAVLLSAFGVYGVVAFAVAERTREIGIRMALGAQTRDLVLLVLVHGARPVVAGLVAGIVGALILSRLIEAMLFGVRPTDGLTMIAVVATVGAVAVAACAGPLRRATRVDPVVALRLER